MYNVTTVKPWPVMQDTDISSINDRAFELLDFGDKLGAMALFEKVCELDAKHSEALMT